MAHKDSEAGASAFDAIVRDASRARLGKKISSDKRPSPAFLLEIGFGPVDEEEEDDEDTEE